MKKTLLCSFSMLVMSPAVPAHLQVKKERSGNVEILNGEIPFYLLAIQGRPMVDMIAEHTTAIYAHPKPPRKKKKLKRRKNLYTTHPSKCKFSRDGSQLRIRK
jgi:hypothetical protein